MLKINFKKKNIILIFFLKSKAISPVLTAPCARRSQSLGRLNALPGKALLAMDNAFKEGT